MPYSPGVAYHGDQYLFEGGRQNTSMLVQWLTNFLDQQKATTAAGKSAEYAAQAHPKMLEDLQVAPDVWKNMGHREKAEAFGAWAKDKAMTLAQQRGELEAAQTQGMLQQQKAGKTFMEAVQRAMGRGAPAGQAAPGAGGGEAPAGEAFGGMPAEGGGGGTPSPEDLLRMGIQSGVDPAKIGTLADSIARVQALEHQKMAGAPEHMSMGETDVIFNRKTGQFQTDPFSKAKATAENKTPAEGHIEIPDPNDPVFGPKIRIPLSQAKKDYPHLLKALEPPDQNYQKELEMARAALAKKADPKKVAAQFKARTGKELPLK